MKTLRLWMLFCSVAVLSLGSVGEVQAWCNPVTIECGSVINANLHSGQTHDDIEQYNCTDTTRWKGNAHVYRLIAPSSDLLTVTLEWAPGADWQSNLGLFILASCNQNRCIDYDAHEISFIDTAGQDYWIIVDGRRNAADAQSYTLSVICGDDPLDVELTSFDAVSQSNGIALTWNVASETNNSHFEVTRSAGEDEEWLTLARIEGRGTAGSAATYNYMDGNVQRGRSYTYRLTSVDLDGSRHELGLTTANFGDVESVVGEFRLLGNYPNPFNPSTKIRFEIAEAGEYSLEVFTMTGSLLTTLVSGNLEKGHHEVEFAASDLGTGVYFTRLSSASGSQMMKMVLMK